jgi:hypothetical protein
MRPYVYVQSRTYSTRAEKFLGKPDGAMYMTAIFNLRTKATRVLDKKGRPYMTYDIPPMRSKFNVRDRPSGAMQGAV